MSAVVERVGLPATTLAEEHQSWHRAREARQHLDVVITRNRQYRYPGGHQFLGPATEITIGFEVVMFVLEDVTG